MFLFFTPLSSWVELYRSIHLNVRLLLPALFCITFLSALLFQCDTSALGGSPSSTLTCSTASPCSESPSSTLNTSAGGQSLLQPLSLPSPHCSPSGTLSGPIPSPAPSPAPGPITRSSPGPPSQSPTSTLESKDSGIIGECCCCRSVGNPAGFQRMSIHEFWLVFTLSEALPMQKCSKEPCTTRSEIDGLFNSMWNHLPLRDLKSDWCH